MLARLRAEHQPTKRLMCVVPSTSSMTAARIDTPHRGFRVEGGTSLLRTTLHCGPLQQVGMHHRGYDPSERRLQCGTGGPIPEQQSTRRIAPRRRGKA
jgi:hypothetical protein